MGCQLGIPNLLRTFAYISAYNKQTAREGLITMIAQENVHSLNFYGTVLIYKDGTLAITESDIKGLFIEVDTLHELISETRWVASHLLESNHGLDAEQIRKSVLHLKFEMAIEDDPKSKTESADLFPSILLSSTEIERPMHYA